MSSEYFESLSEGQTAVIIICKNKYIVTRFGGKLYFKKNIAPIAPDYKLLEKLDSRFEMCTQENKAAELNGESHFKEGKYKYAMRRCLRPDFYTTFSV